MCERQIAFNHRNINKASATSSLLLVFVFFQASIFPFLTNTGFSVAF
jgi:hypothetical protein